MKKSTTKYRTGCLLLCITVTLFIFSCSDNEKNFVSVLKPDRSYLPPDTVLLDTCPPPKITELRNVPQPHVIRVPKKVGDFYYLKTESEEEKIQLKPPAISTTKAPFSNFTNFNTEQGLAVSGIICSYLDKSGNLWFGTMGGGVSRYDGTQFTNFFLDHGLASLVPRCIIEDHNGNIWIGTAGSGVSRYDGISFKTFTTRDGLADNTVFCMKEDKKGNLWFGTYKGGVSRFDPTGVGTRFTNFNTSNGLPSNNITTIEEDKTGNLWFGTFGAGACRYNPAAGGTSFTTFTKEDGLANNNVLCIEEDSKGNLWFGTMGGGVSQYNPVSGSTQFITFTTEQGLTNNSVNCITEDNIGNLWFGTDGGGVSLYDGKTFTNFTTEQGLSKNSTFSITKDKIGNLWFGTFGGGVSRYNGKSFNSFTSIQGLPKSAITSIAEDNQGNIWFGTRTSGVSQFDGKRFASFTTSQGLGGNIVFTIAVDNSGSIWVGTQDGGVSRYDPALGGSFATYTTTQGLANNRVMDIMPDRTGNIWFGTDGGGVSKFDGKCFTNYSIKQGLTQNRVTCMAEGPDGDKWFGTQGGVSRFDGKRFTSYTTRQGLAHNNVLAIRKDKSGNLWFGTFGGGVSRFDGSGFVTFTTRDGLSDDVVYDIVEDNEGVIWMGTNQGLSGLKFNTAIHGTKKEEIEGAGLLKESNDQLKSFLPVWEIYNIKTGYPVKDLNEGAMCISQLGLPYGNKDDIGAVWGGDGEENVIRFNPKAVKINSDPPSVFIRSIKIDETNINWYGLSKKMFDSIVISQQEAMVYGKFLPTTVRDSLQKKFADIQFDSITPFYQLPQNLVLPYKHNRVSFDFGAVETNRNFLVRYQYILEGYDKEWSPVTEKTSASFGNISEGAYTFKIKARSPEGVWSEPVNYRFKVLPPWWRTWWFRTILGVSFLFLLYGIYRWRTASLHKQKRILEKTVKERTAEVVNQKEKSDELLLNILPSEVAEELKEKGYTTARAIDEVTVLFSDIKGFTHVAEKMTAEELVKEIDTYFSAFDHIIMNHKLEKIKTIGDAYVAAGGLHDRDSATAHHVIEAAIAMQQTVEKFKQERTAAGKPYFELRIGIHTGPVVAGVVGIKKFQYDIWGDTVNLAARMEQSGVPGKINISQHTFEIVKAKFACEYRGKIEAKNKGVIDMYFVG